MKKIFILGIFAVGLAACTPPASVFVKKAYNFQKIKNVGVLPFGVPDQMKGKTAGVVAADAFATELLGLGFSVIERTNMEKVLGELKLGESGAIDATTAQQVGKIIGVDAVVLGTITPGLKQTDQTVAVTGPLRRRTMMVSQPVTAVDVTDVNVQSRMVLVETGEILWSGSAARNLSSTQQSLQAAVHAICLALKKQLHL